MRINEEELRSALEKIVITPKGEKKRKLSNALILKLYDDKVFYIWARSIVASNSRHDPEDITNIVIEHLLVFVQNIEHLPEPDEQTLAALLYWQSKRAVRKYIESNTVASNMSGVIRRHIHAERTQQILYQELGREPSTGEIVDRANKTIAQRHKSPTKSGLHITYEDVTGELLNSVPLAEENIVNEHSHAYEAYITIEQLYQMCDKLFDNPRAQHTKQTLHAWITLVLQNEKPTAARISRALGVSRTAACARIKNLENVFRSIREVQ